MTPGGAEVENRPQGQVTLTPRRVLVVKPCCIGDVLLASPLVAAVAAGWPRASVDWAAAPHAWAAAEGIPGVNALVDATGCVPGALSAEGLLRLTLRIRRRAYDLAFVPDRSRALAWAVRWSGIPERVGLDSYGRGRSYTVRVPVADTPVRHEAEVYADLAHAVGLPVAALRLRFVPTEADRTWAAAALGRVKGAAGDRGSGQRLVTLHPGGGVNPGMALREKRWPADRFAEVARRLAAEGASVVVLGGATDGEPVATVLAGAPDAHDMCATAPRGATTLGRTAAILEIADLFLGNDTGIAHLAAAVGTPVVAVFGPTDPRRYGPLPGSGVAVAPARALAAGAGVVAGASAGAVADASGGAVGRLEDARGSRAVEMVTVDAVWTAVEAALRR